MQKEYLKNGKLDLTPILTDCRNQWNQILGTVSGKFQMLSEKLSHCSNFAENPSMLGIEPRTFEFERENRTHCAIKIEKNMFSPDFYRKNTQIYVMFGLFFACWAVNSMI